MELVSITLPEDPAPKFKGEALRVTAAPRFLTPHPGKVSLGFGLREFV